MTNSFSAYRHELTEEGFDITTKYRSGFYPRGKDDGTGTGTGSGSGPVERAAPAAAGSSGKGRGNLLHSMVNGITSNPFPKPT